MKTMDPWVIWSIEHTAWWRANESGYTVHLVEAGVYSQQRAQEIERHANLFERQERAMTLKQAVDDVRALAQGPGAIAAQYLLTVVLHAPV